MTQNPPNYAAMSKSDLITIAETQLQVIKIQQAGLDWFTNSTLPIAARFAGYAVDKFTQGRKPQEDGWFKAYLPVMAEESGVSASTISRGVQILADATEALEKYTHDEWDEDGNKHSTLNFRKLEPFKHPSEVIPTKELKKHGGRRIARCNGCGSENIVEKKTWICADCGQVHTTFESRPVNTPEVVEDTPLQDATAPESSQETADDPEPLLDATLPVDIPVASCNGSILPSTPHADVEGEAAEWLLEIAGEHTEHIEMIADTCKYVTIHRPLHLGDLRTHLRGYKSKGSRLYRADGLTRAICFDADSPEDFQHMREAARSLAIMDFQPLLEVAPLPAGCKHAGGGKLWIVFDGLVDAYSALQTVYQYAGGLRQSKEHWPPETDTGNRVRLPGGKYIHPDFTAWCSLYDADGNELSHDGAGAAAVLLQYQTPVHIVNEYARPEPTPEPERTKAATPGHGGYLEKDLARQAISNFNASHSWQQIVGGFDRRGRFPASWRADRNPNCAVDPQTDLAKDFSTSAWFTRSFDKYECWCLIEGKENWEAFKRLDLAQRCAALREAQAPATHRSEHPCRKCGKYEMLQRDDGLWLCACYFPIVQMEIGEQERRAS